MKNRIYASLLLVAMILTFVPVQLFCVQVIADEQSAVEVEFDTNGGTLISSQTIKKGETITEPDDPTKEGYLFAGWTLNNNPYDFRTPVTESMTLVATWVANSIPSATIGVDILQIDPAYLQMWNDMSLQVATVTTRNCTRADGYKYTRFFRWDVSLTYYSLDPSIASVSNDGTVTSHKLGHTYIWAVSNETKSATFEGSDVSIAQGDILEKIEVVVEETPTYYKNYLENPNTQKITLETNTNQNASIFTSKPESTFGSANIALFYGDTISAFTMTCDDNIMGDFDKWSTLLEEYGIPVTFMAPAYAYYESGAIWKELIYLGHNIQSHSHYHNSSAEYQDGLTTAQAWADFYYGTLDIEKAGIDSLAIAYPCGWNKSSISSMLYIAGRGTRSGMNSMSVEYNCINSYSGFPTNISSSLSQAGYWGCVHSHKMGSIDSNRAQYAQLKTLIDNGTLWATTFEKVAQYAQERDTASVTMYSADQENGVIIFNVTDQMNDELYYQPLTIKITVDNSWEHARATQNGIERSVEIVKENGHTYAYVDAVPDQGNILLIKTTVEEAVEENTITFTLSDCGYHSTVPMTITKELDGTIFDNILVSQGSTTLESTVSQKGGKTYVTFTGYVGETIVIQAKEDVSSCSMTDLYSGRYSPKDGMTITISNATELVLLSDYTNTRRQTKNLTFVLTQDIDMSQIENFIPIGWYVLRESSSSDYFTCSFEGTFDGGEHTIYNFYQNQEYYGSGLFGYAVGATIENFTLKGSIIGHKRVGAICGILNYGTIQNVTFEGNVTSVGIDGDRKSGSYVGVLAGHTIGSTYTNCIVKNTSVITKAATPLTKLRNSYDAAGSSDFNSGNYVGGLVGFVDYNHKAEVKVQTIISNCIFQGSVNSYAANQDGIVSGAQRVGGILGGGMYLCVKNCLVSGDITGDTYVGGIIGYIQQEYSSGITNSSFYGTVKGNSYVGGLTGYLGYNSAAYIKNSYCGATSVVGTSNTGIVVGYVSTSTSGTTTRYGSTTNIYYKDLQGLSVATLGDGSKINAQASDETNALTTLNTWAQTNNENEWSISNEELMAAHLPIFKVTILGYNDEVLSVQYVGNGLNASIPEVKEILGYEFSQWDSSFTNITGNTIIHAEYVTTPTYTVSFYGYDNLLISEVVVNKGKNAIAPTLPHVSGKIFDSWDTSFENVQENISVHANFIDGYVVRFYGMNGALISTQEIGKGLGAQEPEIPIIDGYHFDAWDKEFSDIQENTSVYASYEKNASNALQFNTLQVYLSKKSPSTQEMSTLATELQSAGVSIAFLYGVQVFPTLDETSAYGGAGMKSGRSSTGGLGYGILYQKSKYKLDPTSTSSGATLQKDDCYFALPLQELVTGKQVVAVTLWTGSNSSTGTGTATTFQKLFTSLQASYPNASNYLVGYHTNTPTTKGGSVGLTTSLQAVKLTGYNTKVLYEKQVGTGEEADYLINFSKGTLESTLLSSSKATSITLTTKDAHQGSFKVEDTNTSNKTYYVVSFLNPDDTLIENQYIESGHDATIPENITIPLGYELDSWVGSTTNITSNGAVKLALKEKMYHVIFKDSFGNVIEEKDVQEGSSVSYPTPQDDVVGYHFSSWTIESIDSILEDTEVVANYDKNVYTITYKDSKGNVLFEVPYEFDDEIEFPEVEEKITGYLFSHWVDSLGTIPQDGDKVSKNETYQTIFVESVEITFKTSLGDTIETITIPKGSKATYPQAPSVTGYDFDSWSKASLDVANEGQTITANYKKKTFTITFLDYDGTKLQEISKEYLDEFDMPSYTAPEGHKFEGWYKGSTKVESKQTCQSNETYQVKVSKLKYEVLFKNEDGTQLSKTEVEYGSKATLATPKSKVGYVFVSWMNGETPFDGTESITKALILTPSYQIDESIFNNAIATLENAQTLQNKKEAIQNVEAILGYWTESEVQSLDQSKIQTLQSAKEYYNQARLNALSDLSVIKRMF